MVATCVIHENVIVQSFRPQRLQRLRLPCPSLSPSSVQSVAQSSPTLCEHMNCSTPGLPVHTNSRSLPKLMSIESMMPSSHLILCHPLLLLSSIFPSIRVFSNESALHIRWPSIGISASTSVLPVNTQD